MSNDLKNTVAIPTREYNYLKRIEHSFESFFGYFVHLKEIEKSRKEIKEKKYISQKILFKKLDL